MKQNVVQQWRPKVWDQLDESEKSIASSIEVTERLVQSIQRKRGQIKQKIEAETKTSLSISKKKSACFIVVKGSSDEAVQLARLRIQALMEKAETKTGTKTDTAVDNGEGTKSDSAMLKKSFVGSLQWKPKNEVRSMHTTAQGENWDKLKDMVFSNEDAKDGEKVSDSVQVDKKLLRLIKGHKNEVKERIEKATKTTIRIGIPVVVEGSSEDSVREAVEEIQNIVEEAVNDSKFQYTHFISLPLNMHPSLMRQLEAFQESVMSSHGISQEPADETETGNNHGSKAEVAEQVDTKAISESAQPLDTEVEAASTEKVTGTRKVEEVSAQEAAAITQVFQQSVLASLGLPGNSEQENVEAVLQETVVVSLGLKHGSPEDPKELFEKESELADKPTTASQLEQVSEKVEDDSGHLLKEAADHEDQMEIETGTPKMQDEREIVASEMLEHVSTEAFQKTTMQDDAEQTGQLHMEIEQVGGVSEESVHKTDVDNIKYVTSAISEEVIVTSEESKDEYVPLQEVSFTSKKKGLGSASKSASGIDRSIFIKPSRFHLTVLMLKLWNEEMVNQACEVLQKCLPDVVSALEGKPVLISLRGLEIMKGSPKNTRVLYAKVAEADGSERLSQACQVIINAFVESGLVLGKDREQVLKLHATVMNTSHRKRSNNRYNNKGFDATEILSKFGDECWGDYQIMEAHLSQRFKYDENGYYHCCGSIPFPGNDQKREDIATDSDKEESTEQDSETENEEAQASQQNCRN